MGVCFCSRCIRYDQILKLISLYISYEGDLNILYDNLITKSVTLDKLSVNLLISNIIIIKNDPISKSNKLIKNYIGKKDYEQIDEIIEHSYEYKDKLTELKEYFDAVFNKAKKEKVLMSMDRNFTDICAESNCYILNVLDCETSNSYLNKKKKREETPQKDLVALIESHLTDPLEFKSKKKSRGRPKIEKRIKFRGQSRLRNSLLN
jgi:hypothetical protein